MAPVITSTHIVYANALYNDKGYPLWEPDPADNAPVELGDVGYIWEGHFVKLFNASPREDPWSNKFGLPRSHTPLEFGDPIYRSPLPKEPEKISSEGIRSIDASLELGVGIPAHLSIGAGFSYTCDKRQGGVLVMEDVAYRQDVHEKERFCRYILAHYKSWIEFANNHLDRGVSLHDLILVTGCDKTAKWACAAWSEKEVSKAVEISGSAASFASIAGSFRSHKELIPSVDSNAGPHRILSTSDRQAIITHLISSQNRDAAVENTFTDDATPTLTISSAISLVSAITMGVYEAATNFLTPARYSPAPPPESSQCVFVRGFRIAERNTFQKLTLRKKEFAEVTDELKRSTSGKPSKGTQSGQNDSKSSANLPVSTDPNTTGYRATSDSDVQKPVQHIDEIIHPIINKPLNPMEALIGYIFETSPKTVLALVHDDDLAELLKIYPANNEPCDWDEWVRKLNPSPRIHLSHKGVGTLKPADLTDQVTICKQPGTPYDWTIGNGNFNSVLRGVWRKPSRSDSIDVAVKVFRGLANDPIEKQVEVTKRFLKESEKWLRVTHKNIQPFYGHCENLAPVPAFISPLCQNGTVLEYLRKHSTDDKLRLKFATDIASGLAYLHSQDPDIVQGNLSPSKILIDDQVNARLSGYGRAKILGESGYTTEMLASAPYTAPELLTRDYDENAVFTSRSDVYAWAMVTFEIFTGKVPFRTTRTQSEGQIMLQVHAEIRPSRSLDTHHRISDNLWRLMEACWVTIPKDRLTAKEIISRVGA